MYLKEIEFQNYGSLRNMKYTFQFNPDGTPKPTLFIGKNGSGKTLLLSNIIHSLIEMKRRFYRDIPEVSDPNYYRLGSEHYIYSGENYAYTNINFDNATYTDLMVRNYEKFRENFDPNILPNIPIDDDGLKDNGFYIRVKEPSDNVFQKEIFSFFPVERYYIPTWENKNNDKLRFVFNDSVYVGYNDNSMIKNNLLQDIESWILDILIDQCMFENKLVPLSEPNINAVDISFYISKNISFGKNTNIINMLNNILSEIFKNKYKSVRFRVRPKNKGKRQIQILGMLDNNKEVITIPKFSNLSSGEAMIFGMMASILKDYDTFSDLNSIDFKDISGIVLIDEIDIHLHSDLLKDVLPHLIKIFPKIQFIITSHSPFFLLGMKEIFDEKCNFVTLPTGTITNQIEHFDEIKHCYAIIDNSYKEILLSLDKAQKKLNSLNKPLIITEGKTDWKHIKNALSIFQKNGEFQNLDVDFWENEEEFGDSKLKTLLENLAKIHQSHKIIGIFDSDTKLGNQYRDIHEFGNNVYACCIEDVQNYGCGVSIELLYKREDLTICDDNGRRLYLSDEFKEKTHQLKTNPTIICTNNIIKAAYNEKTIKIVDSYVFDSEENSIALSKNEFANNIYNEIGNFSNVNVEGFRNIIEKIQSICNNDI